MASRSRPWTSVYLPSLEGLFPLAGGYGELVLRVPSTDKRPDRAGSKSSDVTSGHTATTISTAGAATSHGPSMHKTPSVRIPPVDPFPVHTLQPTPALPLDGRALGGSSCGLLVPRECGTLLTSISREQCGGIRSSQMPDAPLLPGDLVWLSTRDLRLRLPSKKLSPRNIGPFPIQRQINEVTYLLQLPPRYRIHPSFHVSLLKPCSSSSSESTEPDAPPPPEILDQPSVYQVRDILDSWRRGGRLQYLIDWEGYGPEERSWVARDDVLDTSLLEEFHRNHSDRPAPRGRPRRRMGVMSGKHHSHFRHHSYQHPRSPDPNHLYWLSMLTPHTLLVRSTVHYPKQYLTHECY